MDKSTLDVGELKVRLENVGIATCVGASVVDISCGTLWFPGIQGQANWAQSVSNICLIAPETSQTVLTTVMWIVGTASFLASYFLGPIRNPSEVTTDAVKVGTNVASPQRAWQEMLSALAQKKRTSKGEKIEFHSCPYCDEQLSEQSNICPSCGHTSQDSCCSTCGKQLLPDAKFCGRCGNDQ